MKVNRNQKLKHPSLIVVRKRERSLAPKNTYTDRQNPSVLEQSFWQERKPAPTGQIPMELSHRKLIFRIGSTFCRLPVKTDDVLAIYQRNSTVASSSTFLALFLLLGGDVVCDTDGHTTSIDGYPPSLQQRVTF